MADRFGPRYAHAMRMRFLLLAALGLGLITALAGVSLDRRIAEPGPPPLAFPPLATRSDSADRIELVHEGRVLWLERRGQVWGLARQGGYPAQPKIAETLMTALATMRLLKPAVGTFDTLHLADPFAPGASSGTLVRVLGTSGAVLCAVVAGPAGSAIVRRPGDDAAWLANTTLTVPSDASGWSQHALPPLDPDDISAIVSDGGLGGDVVTKAMARLEFADVAPAPQHRPAPARTIELALTTGTAVLTVGVEQGQPWLLVSGTAPWATRLAPYAFALPTTNPLAVL